MFVRMRPRARIEFGEHVMGIFGALTTAVGGLRAESYALENVSGNIANSQTTAFKRIDTSFLDLIPQTALTAQLAGGVTTQSRSTNSVQGDVQSAQVATFMAINGSGFFAVQKPGSFTDGLPTFDGVDRYTPAAVTSSSTRTAISSMAPATISKACRSIRPPAIRAAARRRCLKFQNDFLPAQETTKIDYRANLASYPLTTKHDTSTPGSELLAPGSFSAGHNPVTLGTPAAPYTDASTSGTIQSNKGAPSVANTGATLLSGLAGSDSISANFLAGDILTVNGTPITFVNSGAAGNQLNVTDSISTLLAKIDSITGTAIPSTISGGAITLHSGTTSNLSVTSSNPSAFGALGFAGPASATRGGGGTVGTGQVVGNDNSTFLDETVAGGAVTTYDVSGAPVNMQFRWGKVDSASLGAGHADTWNLFYQVNPNATGLNVAWQNANTNFTFSASGQMSPAISSVTLNNAVVNNVALGNPVINFGTGGITQFSDANGNVQVNQISQDGFPAGQLQSVAVSTNGRIVGNYSNGRNLDLAEISLAKFNGHQLPQAHRRRRVRSDRRVRRGAVSAKAAPSSALRWRAPIPTSPTSSPS